MARQKDLGVRRWAAALALALTAASPAIAQTTTCENTFYGAPQLGVTCETKGGRSAPVGGYRWQDVEPRKCSVLEAGAGIADLCSARAVAAARKNVGDLIAAGKCDEALKAALGTGDLQYASEVRAFCAGQK